MPKGNPTPKVPVQNHPWRTRRLGPIRQEGDMTVIELPRADLSGHGSMIPKKDALQAVLQS